MSNIDIKNIVYINLDRDIDRRVSIERQLKDNGLSAQRFSAISNNFDKYSRDWEEIFEPDFKDLVQTERLSEGEIGCLLSHLEVIRLYGSEDMLVLEDDVDLSVSKFWNFSLSELLSNLPADAKVVQLVKYKAYSPINVKKLVVGNQDGGSWGTPAYVIKSDFSKYLVDNYFIDGKWEISRMPADWNRKTIDAILYSFGNAYTTTILSLKYFKSSIGASFSDINAIGNKITKDLSRGLDLQQILKDPISYTIVHVDDRAEEYIDSNKSILKTLKYVNDIEFFNGNVENPWDVLHNRNIMTDVWNPYDGRSFPPLPGELGVWISTINIWDYIIENNLESLLVLEDDVSLAEDASKKINLFISELPDNWDFLSLHYFNGKNKLDKTTDIGSKYIHKSLNQYASGQAILYSQSGAQKLRNLVQQKGIEYTSDCFVFEQARVGNVNGYSLNPNTKNFVTHEHKNIKSLIDPDNTRKTEM